MIYPATRAYRRAKAATDAFIERQARRLLGPEPSDTAFDHHAITQRVRRELRDMTHLTPEEIAWIVEATLFQLPRLARDEGTVDLDYLGEVRLQANVECDTAACRTTYKLVWDLPGEQVQILGNGEDHA